MAALVAFCFEGLPDSELPTLAEVPTQPLYRASDKTLMAASLNVRPCGDLPPSYYSPPPTYEDSLNDNPPDYTTTNELASAKIALAIHTSYNLLETSRRVLDAKLALVPKPSAYVDWIDSQGIRNHANKKKKQAEKKAQQAKWADSGDEEDGAKNGEDEDHSGDGGAGRGAGGSGGAGGDGGGGDDGDDWNDAGAGKKKKKSKKGKKQDEDEDEDEEEKKDNGDSHALTGMPGNFWDNNAGDANPDDEWGTANAKKGKKGKKTKGTEAVPPPPPAAPMVPGGFSNLDEIDLDGSGANHGSKDTKGSQFGFGSSWGGGWGFGGIGNVGADKKNEAEPDKEHESSGVWGFGSGKKDKKDKKKNGFDYDLGLGEDPTHDAHVDSKKEEDSWATTNQSSGKKDKKLKRTSGFGALEEAVTAPAITVIPEPEESVDMGWGGWGGSKKDKKKDKKGGVDEHIPPPPPPEEPAEPEVDDLWSSSNKKDKKKTKKGTDRSSMEPAVVVVPEPEPTPLWKSQDAGADVMGDNWNSWGTSNDKKKSNKKGSKDEGPTPVTHVSVPEAAKAAAGGGKGNMWDAWGSSPKDEKNKTSMWGTYGGLDDMTNENTSKPAGDTDWMNWNSTGKMDKKKTKKGEHSEEMPPPPPPAPEPLAADPAEEDWMAGMWGGSKKDKDKKAKKGKHGETESPTDYKNFDPKADAVKDAKFENEPEWGASSKKDKKGKDSKKNEPEITALPAPRSSEKKKDFDEDAWGTWGASTKDKKKGKKDDASNVPPPVPTPPNLGLTPGSSPPFGENDDLDDDDLEELMLEDWSAPAASKAKGKKDEKQKSPVDGRKGDKLLDAKSSKKGSEQAAKDAIAALDDYGKLDGKTADKSKVKDDTSPKTMKSMWGSMNTAPTSSKDKSSKEKEKEKEREKEKEKQEEEKEKAGKGEKVKKDKGEVDTKSSKRGKMDEVSEGKKGKVNEYGDVGGMMGYDMGNGRYPGDKMGQQGTAMGMGMGMGVGMGMGMGPGMGMGTGMGGQDAWNFWGASGATGGSKTKPEIAGGMAGMWANQGTSFVDPSQTWGARGVDQPPPSQAAPALKKGSVADRIKAFQGDKNAGARLPPDAALPPQPPAATILDPRKESKDLEAKGNITKKPTSKTLPKGKDISSKPADVKQPSYIPGGFPQEDGFDMLDLGVATAVPIMMGDKAGKKSDKKSKSSKAVEEDLLFVPPPAPVAPPVSAPKKGAAESKKASAKNAGPAKLPTPPPESDSDVKPVKKERPRVVRDQAASSSWGFWGTAAPKQPREADRKVKNDVEVPSVKKERSSAPGLSRSKSARKASDKDTSSPDDSDDRRKPDARPAKPTRGVSMTSALASGPPMTRSKSTRQSVPVAKSSSKRNSVPVASALPSPPPDDDVKGKVSDKAAKILGIGKRNSMPARSQSMREKSKRSIPDPYAIDVDEALLSDGPNGVQDMFARPRSAKASRVLGGAGTASGRPETARLGEERGSMEPLSKRPDLKRSASSAKQAQGFMSLFGTMRKRDRRPSQDSPEDAEARRAERRARHAERDLKAGGGGGEDRARDDARKAKTRAGGGSERDRDRDRQRQEDDERRARRAARAERQAVEEAAAREADEERRRRRRTVAEEPHAGRPRNVERRASTFDDSHRSNNKPRSPGATRRGGDYFDKGNATAGKGGRPYLARGDTDKTTSWVHSFGAEPPLPVPRALTPVGGVGAAVGDVGSPPAPVRERIRERERGDGRRKSLYRREREKERDGEREGARERRVSGGGGGGGVGGGWFKKLAGF